MWSKNSRRGTVGGFGHGGIVRSRRDVRKPHGAKRAAVGSGDGPAALARRHARGVGLAGVGVSQRRKRNERTIWFSPDSRSRAGCLTRNTSPRERPCRRVGSDRDSPTTGWRERL